ncbi:hypothetical protein DJ568_09425 [Mucilaginibacter hurinus]|uniref:1-phosphatidylinositol phosphodiesterase n=1 Tax=Mucilaginibacter hurinus TaxID=2201324 RepID=A0A367GPT1_9SPHI|nr:phosphatidylinositol-specific phospholipase C domain-containing protein [Mucilaginibacter hurinus]RCH54703.1 hypothetical protein DJ568_09425 [Mucilaginibacter hurinus]
MVNSLIKQALITTILTIIVKAGLAQSLAFSYPANYLPDVSTDRALDITNFKGGFFVTWKNAGASGNVNVCYLGKQYESKFIEQRQGVDAQTAFAPAFTSMNNRLYTLWINTDGGLNYIVNKNDTAFNVSDIRTCSFNTNIKLHDGITAAAVGNKLIIASRANDKNSVVYAVLQPNADGTLGASGIIKVPNVTSDNYPFIVGNGPKTARLLFKGYKDTGIYYADFDIQANTWTGKSPLLKSQTEVSPAVYKVLQSNELFYVWNGPKKDNNLYYAYDLDGDRRVTATALPGYFATALPVSICSVDDRKFILSYVGEDGKLYISYFTDYNPANWMETELMTTKADKTLKDIVIPGSHDAGLSVLNGVGGMQSGPINECNTLTQKLSVGQQLNAGLRMFDIRVGTHKNAFYTKHCSSDCMEDSFGGAYGEKLADILTATKAFLEKNKKEIVIMTLSHFCERETPMKKLSDTIFTVLGNHLYYEPSKDVSQIKLSELAGKAIVTFEGYALPDKLIDSSSMAKKSKAFLNIRREYAATNKMANLLLKQNTFFSGLAKDINQNDLVRLDWQLTQSPDEAAMICNDFESKKPGLLINSAMLLTNMVKKYKSIIDHSIMGNKFISKSVNDWINAGVITKTNKPNILYVDVAGSWITDYCIELNKSKIYN